jgi:hypothetical protein
MSSSAGFERSELHRNAGPALSLIAGSPRRFGWPSSKLPSLVRKARAGTGTADPETTETSTDLRSGTELEPLDPAETRRASRAG